MKYFEIYSLLIIEQGVNEALQSVSNSGSPASTHRIMKRKKNRSAAPFTTSYAQSHTWA